MQEKSTAKRNYFSLSDKALLRHTLGRNFLCVRLANNVRNEAQNYEKSKKENKKIQKDEFGDS